MAVLRFLSSLFLLVAVIALAADMSPLLYGSGGIQATPFASHWEQIAPASLSGAKSWITAGRAPFLWTYGIELLIALPSYVLFGILAALCGYWGRRRHKVEIFIN